MVKEAFVTFDTAKRLKEIGFDIPVNMNYSEDRNFEYNLFPDNFNKIQDKFSRPTQALAARWLREVHHIDIVIDIISKEYYCYVLFQDKRLKTVAGSIKPSFEEVLEEALKDALELIKE